MDPTDQVLRTVGILALAVMYLAKAILDELRRRKDRGNGIEGKLERMLVELAEHRTREELILQQIAATAQAQKELLARMGERQDDRWEKILLALTTIGRKA